MPKTEFSRAYDSFGHFKPLDEWFDDGGQVFEYGNGLLLDSKKLSFIIHMQHFFLVTTQRIECLEKKMRPMQKSECTKDELKKLQEYEEETEMLKRLLPDMEINMYCGEARLPERPLKRTYDKIRQNPAWYLRAELVNDCKGRGGCCSRSCGCCEHRLRSQNTRRGIGHCTVECWCCEVSRGFEMSEEERVEMIDYVHGSFETTSHLLRLAEAYFCMPGMFGLGRISFVRTIAWHWKKGGLWQWRRVSNWLK
jgi:hypothetical protein